MNTKTDLSTKPIQNWSTTLSDLQLSTYISKLNFERHNKPPAHVAPTLDMDIYWPNFVRKYTATANQQHL